MEEWHLDTRRLGRRTLYLPRTDSTNTQAAALATDLANDGLVIVAGEQTQGRGQHGRTWQAPAGESVLLSVLLFPPPALRRPVLLAAWVADAVCTTVARAAGLSGQIKWPNDVLVASRKVAGVLIETRTRGPDGVATIAGVGLNVNQSAETFARAGLPLAASLAALTGRTFDCAATARLLIEELDAGYDRLQAGDLAGLEARWRERTGLVNTDVVVEAHNGTHPGLLVAQTWAGLELEQPDGQRLHFQPESVRHLRPYNPEACQSSAP